MLHICSAVHRSKHQTPRVCLASSLLSIVAERLQAGRNGHSPPWWLVLLQV